VCGSLIHKAIMRWAVQLSPHEVVAEVAVDTLSKFPSILACLLIALGCATCGSLALCVGCVCYFFKVSKLYQEYLETLVKRAVGLRDADDPSLLLAVNFQLSLALLWLMVTMLNLPTLLTWMQNIPHGLSIPADPSLIHMLILCGSLVILWQNEGKPRINKKYYAVLAIILQGLAIFIATFAMITVYRISFAISAVFVAVTSHQLISPEKEPEIEEEEEVEVEEDASNVLPAETAESASESEYEVEYKVNISKKKIKKPGVLKSASEVTDTGFGTEGLDWEFEDEGDATELSEDSGKEDVL